MKLFERLFCKHDYKLSFHKNFMRGFTAKTLLVWKCIKCNKQIKQVKDL